MYLENVLIEARDLVNGVSVVQPAEAETVAYFHIELDAHDLIVAEGAISESFVDDDSRNLFQNADEHRRLYPGVVGRPARYCAPRLASGDIVDLARRKIALRAGLTSVAHQLSGRCRLQPQALIVDTTYPEIGDDGGSAAIFDHMRALRTAGFEVSFLAAQLEGPSGEGLAAIGVARLQVDRASPREVFRQQAGRFDLIYLHRAEIAGRYLELARRHSKAEVVYSVADLHHLRLIRQSRVETDAVRSRELAGQAFRMGRNELGLAWLADRVITHSALEAEQIETALEGTGKKAKVHRVPWSVPRQPVRRPFRKRWGVAFIGFFRHEPNLDAAAWLVNEVMPLVWRNAPDIDCLLVGSAMPPQILGMGRPNVKGLGRMENLAELFERVRLTVAPLRFGAGIKDKVIRSFGAAVPCVGTEFAFEGLPDLPPALTRHCIGDGTAALAAAILRMHHSEAVNASCAQAGFSYVAANFTESRIDALMQQAVEPALKQWRQRRAAERLRRDDMFAQRPSIARATRD